MGSAHLHRVEGVEYTSEAVDAARTELVDLRNFALGQSHFEWAVLLSHVIAYLAEYSDMLNEKGDNRG